MADTNSSSGSTRQSLNEPDFTPSALSVDYDAIWRYQDEVRTCVNACLGDYIWNLSYNPKRQCLEMELNCHLDDEQQAMLSSQLTLPTDYDGEGSHGSLFVIYPW